MVFANQRLWKLLFLTGVIIIFLTGAIGLPHFGMAMEMDMDGNMTMTNCYMPGMTAVCNMSALEHIAGWQGMFTSLLSQNLALALLFLVLAVVLGFVWLRQAYSPPQRVRTSFRFSRRREYIPLHSSLQELFSNGILNPKVF